MKRIIFGLMLAMMFCTLVQGANRTVIWGIQRSGFFNGRGKWAKGFENQMV